MDVLDLVKSIVDRRRQMGAGALGLTGADGAIVEHDDGFAVARQPIRARQSRDPSADDAHVGFPARRRLWILRSRANLLPGRYGFTVRTFHGFIGSARGPDAPAREIPDGLLIAQVSRHII